MKTLSPKEISRRRAQLIARVEYCRRALHDAREAKTAFQAKYPLDLLGKNIRADSMARKVLLELSGTDWAFAVDIAHNTSLGISTVHRHLRLAMTEGWVTRAPSGFSLTDKGREALTR